MLVTVMEHQNVRGIQLQGTLQNGYNSEKTAGGQMERNPNILRSGNSLSHSSQDHNGADATI